MVHSEPMKNLIIAALIRILHPFFKMKTIPNKVLVVSTTGLGDTMWAVPALRALHRSGKQIILLTGPYGSQLLKHCPYPSKMFVTNHAPMKHLFTLFRALKKERCEEIFVFHASQRPLFPLFSLLKPRALHGFIGRNKGLDFLFTHLIEKKNQHELSLRLALAGHADASSKMELFTSPEKTEEHRIALIPGSKDPYKRWPKEYFIALGNALAKHPYSLYIIGSSDEKELVAEIANAIPHAIPKHDMSLEETIRCIQSCVLCITNDTGPMHIAFAADIPTIALFSPTFSEKYGPLDTRHARVIERDRPCSPCLRRKCHDNFCMRQISPETVYREAQQWLT